MRGDERYLSGEFSRRCKDGSTGFHSFRRGRFSSGLNYRHRRIQIDTTERRRIEEDLIRSEKLFHALFDSMIEGVALHEMAYGDDGACIDYVILDANAAFERHTGISAQVVRGKKASAAYGSGSAPYLDIYLKVVTTGEPEQFETYFPPMDKHFMISAFRVSDNRFATVFEDITERKLAEGQIRSLLAEKDLLLREVHHRIKNNITP
jgi:PAS domain-containing protein